MFKLEQAIRRVFKEHYWALLSAKDITDRIGYSSKKRGEIAYVRQGLNILEKQGEIRRVAISTKLKKPYHTHRTILYELAVPPNPKGEGIPA